MGNSATLNDIHFNSRSLANATWFLGNLHATLALPAQTANTYTLLDCIYREGYGPPPHLHTREDDLLCVVEGKVRIKAGATEAEYGPGAVAYLPRDRAHTFEPLDGQVRLLIAVLPGGLETYFNAFSRPAESLGPEPDPVTMPDMEQFIAAGADFGLEFLPPGASVAGHPSNEKPGLKEVICAGGEGECLNVLGVRTLVKLSAEQTGGMLSAFITEDPKLAGPPLHIHRKEDESFFVLEGDYRFQVGEEFRDASAGDTVFIPRGVPHTYARIGDDPGRLFVWTTPGGFDHFFREVDRLCAAGPPEVPAVVAVGEKHGIEFVGPPIEA